MHYTVQQLATLAGVSARTLRYYDSIGLLKPSEISKAGYRLYTATEADQLQQILFYRELEFPLAKIGELICSSSFDQKVALKDHLKSLREKQNRLALLIENAQNTLLVLEGENIMTDAEKFKGFKEESVKENEKKYGTEIRTKYSEECIDLANAKKLNMSEEEYERYINIEEKLNETLRLAVATQNPHSELAQEAAALHKEWLQFSLPNYTPAIHLGIAAMYTADPRFSEYYEKIVPGGASFIQQAIEVFLQK